MQQAYCYLLGGAATVLELGPPITLATQKHIWRLTQHLVNAPNVLGTIPGMNSITVILHDPQTPTLDTIEHLQRWWEEGEALEPNSRLARIPIIYGGELGPNLAEVARHNGLSDKQVVELHAPVDYVVWFIGLRPGFPYLGSLPEQLRTPRRAGLRLLVPAGPVGIGGSQAGIYPLVTPGGQQLVGRASVLSSDPKREEPILSQASGTVRFVPQKERIC